jgi:hypothetical protein
MELDRMKSGKLQKEMAGHTGHSSQLFPVTPGRNAQFLATVARGAIAWQVDSLLDYETVYTTRRQLFPYQFRRVSPTIERN